MLSDFGEAAATTPSRDVAIPAKKAGSKGMPLESRPAFGVTIVEESNLGITKDVTVLHSDWASGKKGPGVEIYVPGPKRTCIAWQASHTYFSFDGSEMFICNICGKDLKLSGTAGAISSHLKRKHPGIKEKMEQVEHRIFSKSGSGRKRAAELPMSSSKASKAVKTESGGRYQSPASRQLPSSFPKKGGPRAEERKALFVQAQKQAQIMHLIGEGLPFSYVESRWHKQLIETTVEASRAGATDCQLEMPTKEATTRVFVTSKKLREYLKQRIKGKDLCAAANHWTSRQNVMYVSFSVQWIENFKLESAVLAVCVLKGGQMKESLMKDFKAKLQFWEFGSSIKFVVTDRETSRNAFGGTIETLASTERVACLDYLLNLVATKAFEGALGVGSGGDFGEFDAEDDAEDTDSEYDEDDVYDTKRPVNKKNLLPKARKLVGHFEASIQASDELLVIAKQLCASAEERNAIKALEQDVGASWWSTQNMLERLFALREAVTTYVSRKWMPGATTKENRPPRLTEEEWEVLLELHFMLRPLRFAQQMLQGQKSITSSFVPLVIHLIYQELESIYREESNSNNVKTIAREMLNMMDELFGNFASRDNSSAALPLGVAQRNNGKAVSDVRIHKAILMAHALDPRFKPLSVFPPDVQEKIWSNLLEEMVRLGPTMSTEKDEEEKGVATKDGDEVKPTPTGLSELDSLFQLYKQPSRSKSPQQKTEGDEEFDAEAWKQKCEAELKQYQEAPGMEPKMDSNVVQHWWGEESMSETYPVLWRVAQRVLCINATSAPAHRAFSSSINLGIHNRCKMGVGDSNLHFLHENSRRLDDEGLWDA